jgi:hypothetical protein
MEPGAVVARQFDERLRSAVERRALRILGVRTDRAPKAALTLGRHLGVEPVAFDQRLLDAVRRQMSKMGIASDDVIHAADRAGPAGKHWSRLVRLVEAAADELADELLPPAEPLLLVQPGPIARYGLDRFLTRLVEASKSAEAAAILLLVPSHDTGGIPRINGELAIPGALASHVLWVSGEWIGNQHNKAA